MTSWRLTPICLTGACHSDIFLTPSCGVTRRDGNGLNLTSGRFPVCDPSRPYVPMVHQVLAPHKV
jgi:hypothetical protein